MVVQCERRAAFRLAVELLLLGALLAAAVWRIAFYVPSPGIARERLGQAFSALGGG